MLLSETFSTGFATETRDPDAEQLGEPFGGPSSQFLAEQAACATACGSAARARRSHRTQRRTIGARTTRSCSPGPNGEMHRYRKIHPFSFGGEDKHFRGGDAFTQVEIDGLRVTMFVCYDLRFADEFWQLAPTTDVYLVPANWPESRRAHWMALLQARAIENQAYVVGCNRVGVRRRTDVLRRQPDRRPARRAARHCGEDGEHPARRHLRRGGRRRARPLPLHPGPAMNGPR